MTRYTKNSAGNYVVGGQTFQQLFGHRAQVWHGTAYKTSGGLVKSDLIQNKHGRIVSRKKQSTAKRENRLVKAGYGTKKGTFGFVKLGSMSHHKKRKHGSRRRRSMSGGGMHVLSPESL